MASVKFDEYKEYFDTGKWSKEMIHMATEREVLTEAEYLAITQEEYVPIIYKYDSGTLTELAEKGWILGDPNATSNTHSTDSGSTGEDTNDPSPENPNG